MQLHSSTLFYFCAGGDFGTSQFHIQANQIVEKMSLGIPWDRCVGSKVFLSFYIVLTGYTVFIQCTGLLDLATMN